MKYINILAFVIAATIIASVVAGPRRTHSWSTGATKTDGGKVYYLDRQTINCGTGALTYFQMTRPSNPDQIQYKTSCVRADAITNQVQTKSTAWNKIGGEKEVQYLDRHDISCPTGTVISYFKQGRNGSKINYTYKCVKAHLLCCRNTSTPENDMGDMIFYLDRHHVGNYKSFDWAIQRFKLDSGYSPKRVIKYSYRICKLKDMDAEKQVEANKATLASEQAALAEARTKLAASEKNMKAIQDQLTKLTAQLQAATNGHEADAKAVEASHERIVAAQSTLASSEKDPGLTC